QPLHDPGGEPLVAVVGAGVRQLWRAAHLNVGGGDRPHGVHIAAFEGFECRPDELDVAVALAQDASFSKWNTRFRIRWCWVATPLATSSGTRSLGEADLLGLLAHAARRGRRRH